MVNVAPFNAKVVCEPKVDAVGKGRVCNMRVRQIDPGRPSMFIDVAVFREDLVDACEELSRGAVVEILIGELVYDEWEQRARRGAPLRRRSKHVIVAKHLEVLKAG